MSRLFASSDQSIGASTSVLPINIQGWFLLVVSEPIAIDQCQKEDEFSFPSLTYFYLKYFFGYVGFSF